MIKIAEANTYAIDSSTLVRSVVPHTVCETEKSSGLIDLCQKGLITLVAPEIFKYEIANAIRRLTKISAEDYSQIINSTNIVLLPLEYAGAEKAMDFAQKYQLSYYDAAYCAMAYQLNCPLITADKRLKNAIGSEITVGLVADLEFANDSNTVS